MGKVTNYGRWGKEDEKGTLNLISESSVLSALRMPTEGKVYSLGAKVGSKGPKAPRRKNRKRRSRIRHWNRGRAGPVRYL